MARIIFTLVALCAVLVTTVAFQEMTKSLVQRLAMREFWQRCWGKQNNVDRYLRIKAYADECLLIDANEGLFENTGDSSNSAVMAAQAANTPDTDYKAAILKFLASQQEEQQKEYMKFFDMLDVQPANGQKRWKREAILGALDEEELELFGEYFGYEKEAYENMLKNLTCTLLKIGAIDEQYNINMQYYAQDLWNQQPEPVDPIFKQKMIVGYRNCFALSRGSPKFKNFQSQYSDKFVRLATFFQCTKKLETEVCGRKELIEWIEEWYGPYEGFTVPGLPEDKYEGSTLIYKVLGAEQSKTEARVVRYIFGHNN